MLSEIKILLDLNSNPNNEFGKKILQIVPGGYGEEDILLGVKSIVLRKAAKEYYKKITNEDLLYLLNNNIHEYRVLAVMIMVLKYKINPQEMFKMYIENLHNFNNWDIIDISCSSIIGNFIYDNFNDTEIFNFLSCLYDSDNFWYRRISIVSTMYLIKKNKIDVCLDFFIQTVNDAHHLNNKALGWMLREIGKKDKKKLIKFIKSNKLKNITFNYCTEKFAKEEKSKLKSIALLIICLFIPFNVFAKEEVTLSKCVDGDTAKFVIEEKVETVRFLAIDTEESVSTRKLNTYMGIVASDYTCDMLENASKIEIEYDPGSDIKDKYDRTLGWVFVDDSLLQEKIIERGYGKVAYLYGDYKYTSLLEEKEEDAKEKGLGIWDKGNYIEIIYNLIQKFIKLFT